MEIIEFDAVRTRRYVSDSIDAFLRDPPDSDFQRGYLAALCAIYREALNVATDDRLQLWEHLVS